MKYLLLLANLRRLKKLCRDGDCGHQTSQRDDVMNDCHMEVVCFDELEGPNDNLSKKYTKNMTLTDLLKPLA